MVTIKELEKERINKIKSLNKDEIDNYADILIGDMCNILDLDNVVDVSKSENEFADLIKKLDELYDLTGYNFKAKADESYKAMLTIQLIRYIIKDNESRNDLLLSLLSNLILNYANLKNYLIILYQLLMDFKELSDVAPDTVANMKLQYIESLKKLIMESKLLIETAFYNMDHAFYSDDKIKSEIHDVKVYIKTINESDDESDKLLVKCGFNSIYSGFIDVYKTHAEIKEIFMQYKPGIVSLLNSSGNVFEKYSAAKYDAATGISFDEYMKFQPKFNIDTGELIEP